MIKNGPSACKMKDIEGLLPAHLVCYRGGSVDKLMMVLNVYPQALMDRTNKCDTLLSLAKAHKDTPRDLICLLEAMEARWKR